MDFCVGIVRASILQKLDERSDRLHVDIFARHILQNNQRFKNRRITTNHKNA